MKASSCLIAWLALAACGGASKSAAPPSPPPTPVEKPAADVACPQAVDGMFAVTAANEPPDLRARSTKVFVHRCETDHWSAEVRQCMASVQAPEDADRCEAMLTPEQKRELSDELSRELDAAGVKPEMESGRPRPKPSAAPAPKNDMPKPAKSSAAPAPKKEEMSKPAKPSAPRGGSKAPVRTDPCEGGE